MALMGSLLERLAARLEPMEVLDTHTHLVGDRLGAADFWELAHYFWLFRELQAAGYPAHAEELPVEARAEAFIEAHRASRHTMMNKALTVMLRDLYGIALTDAASVLEADAVVRECSLKPGWAQQVADRTGVRRYVVNHPEHARFEGMREDALLLPRIDGRLSGWVNELLRSANRSGTYERIAGELESLLSGYRKMGCPGIMTTLPGFEAATGKEYPLEGANRDELVAVMLHAICSTAYRHELLVQLFAGVERSWCSQPLPVNDPRRILKLAGLFDRYDSPFELVVASELNNLDVVQAAWTYPHVHTGGMWWFNFRTSTYKQVMQYRLEALPTLKSSLVASDSRCIEWTYGKIWLVKRALTEFLAERVAAGWLEEAEAAAVAHDWLYASAARRYGVEEKRF